jgi:hypothetical protein
LRENFDLEPMPGIEFSRQGNRHAKNKREQ